MTSSSFVILRREATGGPSGAREREPVAKYAVSNILPEQFAFGASPGPIFGRPEDDEASPGLRCASPEDDERGAHP